MKAVVTKLLESFAVIVAVIVFNFILIYLAPGDAVDALAGGGSEVSPEVAELLREQYGLDKPIPIQLLTYIGNVLQGDFGYSVAEGRPAIDVILPRIGPTLLLAFSALLFAVVIGTAAGTIAARKPESLFSNGLTVFALVGFSMPVFWTGILFIIAFGVELKWLPISGMVDLRMPSSAGFFARALDVLHHLVLPTLSLGLIYLASYARLARASMLEVLQSDYIRTARAKGLAERTVLFKHALRNGVIPIVTVIGMQFGVILSGAILVETVFSWPGLGRLAFESVLHRDTNVLLAILTMVSTTVIIANLVTDLVYRLIDPRIRVSGDQS